MAKTNQIETLEKMKKLINRIRRWRNETGTEHKDHAKIWKEIDSLYWTLDNKHMNEFDNYCN
jgi:uncharacterized protein (UPF0335 family)